eukprot:c26427_g1_i8 orf=107-1060(+)
MEFRVQSTASLDCLSRYSVSASVIERCLLICKLTKNMQYYCSSFGPCAGNAKIANHVPIRHHTYAPISYGSPVVLRTFCKRRGLNTCSKMQNIYKLLVHASIDDEFHSPRNIALGLHWRYRQVVEHGFSNNLKEFINAGVTAYAVGCTAEGLRRELLSVRDSDLELDIGLSAGYISGLKSKLTSEEIEECILWLSIIFITILCTPQPTVVRWSSVLPVSADTQLQWRGFCALIANAYYIRGMAWFSVKTLQLEQVAVLGYAEEPAIVADRMRQSVHNGRGVEVEAGCTMLVKLQLIHATVPLKELISRFMSLLVNGN